MADAANDITILDELIQKYGRVLMRRSDDEVKIGEFIKMIELRRKLTPAESDQKKFWRMLDDIRREEMGHKPQTAEITKAVSRKKRRRRSWSGK